MFEPKPGGGSRLVGVEWVVFKSAWEGAGNTGVPSLFGRSLKLVPEGNRYGIPAFYQLHAWIWKPNPAGTYEDWNPRVSCRGTGRLTPLERLAVRTPLDLRSSGVLVLTRGATRRCALHQRHTRPAPARSAAVCRASGPRPIDATNQETGLQRPPGSAR